MVTKRVVILGGPKTGKTTLAKTADCPVRHTDNTMGLGWSEGSEAVAEWFDEPGPWVVEGVACARALRKWLQAHPVGGLPCDVIVVLHTPHVEWSKGQMAMTKGINKVFGEIMEQLGDMGVEILHYYFETPKTVDWAVNGK